MRWSVLVYPYPRHNLGKWASLSALADGPQHLDRYSPLSGVVLDFKP